MAKPDDIPQDIWNYAHRLHMDEGMLTHGKPNVTRLVARAIMAEREACAQVIEDFTVDLDTWDGPTERSVASAATDYACIDLAEAVRNRGRE